MAKLNLIAAWIFMYTNTPYSPYVLEGKCSPPREREATCYDLCTLSWNTRGRVAPVTCQLAQSLLELQRYFNICMPAWEKSSQVALVDSALVSQTRQSQSDFKFCALTEPHVRVVTGLMTADTETENAHCWGQHGSHARMQSYATQGFPMDEKCGPLLIEFSSQRTLPFKWSRPRVGGLQNSPRISLIWSLIRSVKIQKKKAIL